MRSDASSKVQAIPPVCTHVPSTARLNDLPSRRRAYLEELEGRRLFSFSVGGDYPAGGGNPQVVVAADLNGDGRADLAVVNGQGGTVSVLLAQSGGGFGTPQSFAANAGVGQLRSLAAADLNGDGKTDLVTTSSHSDPAVLRGNGDGTFQSPQPVPLVTPDVPEGEYVTAFTPAMSP